MKPLFVPAVRSENHLRLGLLGPSGAGKTMSALRIATALTEGQGDFVLIDSEGGSASLYADRDNPDGGSIAFHTLDIQEMPGRWRGPHDPQKYISAIRVAAEVGYPVLVLDGLSGVWSGPGGMLEWVATMGGDKRAWANATPVQNLLLATIKAFPGHVIATFRTKTVSGVEAGEGGGLSRRKVGLQVIQRDEVEYEFDVLLLLEAAGRRCTVDKTRFESIPPDATFEHPGADVARLALDELGIARARFDRELAAYGLSASALEQAFAETKQPDPMKWRREKRETLLLELRDGSAWDKLEPLGLTRPSNATATASTA